MALADFFGRKKQDENARNVQGAEKIKGEEKEPYEIKIVRSGRRKKTVSARLVDNVMVVQAPRAIPDVELDRIVEKFKKDFKRRQLKKELDKTEDLGAVAERLNEEYFNGSLNIKSIKYVTNQNRRFGSCSYRTREIRISHHLAEMPAWVRDYVIVHEMAHLIEPNHGRSFWDIVSRYELTERARGYLVAKGMDDEDDGRERGG